MLQLNDSDGILLQTTVHIVYTTEETIKKRQN